ncbi:hypothetical protein [Streptomyces sirii]|uniref:hypothetical protein n=1 Tax=Streptomyces sirii TaxID=3127701 RepID=UPI003D37016A
MSGYRDAIVRQAARTALAKEEAVQQDKPRGEIDALDREAGRYIARARDLGVSRQELLDAVEDIRSGN